VLMADAGQSFPHEVTMKVRFLTCMVGADFVRNAGDVAELPDAEAARLIEGGVAEPVKLAAKLRTTKAPQPRLETATLPPGN
jgi:hypothetical protein